MAEDQLPTSGTILSELRGAYALALWPAYSKARDDVREAL
jgi:hypothetical protein